MHSIASSTLAILLLATANAQQPTPPPAKAGEKPAAASPEKAPDKAPADQAAADKAAGTQGQDKAKATAEKLEQLVAPIALYPDSLLSQVLMASTYPLEIVQASRWLKEHPGLKPDALEKALQEQTWDPSVKALCGLPTALAKLNDNLDWTQDLGDAFLADKAALMDTVQVMRRKALEAGKLETTKEQKVTEREDKMIVIESASPEVVYVPTYYPTACYGSWSYPYYYYPPMYVAPRPGYAAFAFTAGVVWGAAVWGGCHWGGHGHCDVDINVNQYNNFVDRTERTDRRDQAKQRGSEGKFKHNPESRKGVRYGDQATAKQYDKARTGDRGTRDQARGRDGANRPGTSDASRPGTRDAARPGTRDAARPSAGTSNNAARAKPSTSGQKSGGLSGAKAPKADRSASQRGSASRGSSSRSGGGGARSGGGRSGGGGRGGGDRR